MYTQSLSRYNTFTVMIESSLIPLPSQAPLQPSSRQVLVWLFSPQLSFTYSRTACKQISISFRVRIISFNMFLRFIHVVVHTSSLFFFIAEYNLFYGNITQKYKVHGKKKRLFNPGAGLSPSPSQSCFILFF